MAILSRGTRALGTGLETLALQLTGPHVDIPLIQLFIRELRTAGKLGRPALLKAVTRLDVLLRELPKLGGKLQHRRTDLSHLFGDGLAKAMKDPLKRQYLSGCDDLRELARSEDFKRLLETSSSRKRIEKYAMELMQSLSRVVDRYGDLYRESYLLNALTRRLYPGKAIEVGLRVDAQHIIEQRAFTKWRKDWALLGWESELDMPAVSIMHDWHIPSPKNLPGMGDVKLGKDLDEPIADVFSLTKEMEANLKMDSFKTAEDYLKAAKAFYKISIKNKRGDAVEPLNFLVECVEHTEKELAKARSVAALVKAAKKLR